MLELCPLGQTLLMNICFATTQTLGGYQTNSAVYLPSVAKALPAQPCVFKTERYPTGPQIKCRARLHSFTLNLSFLLILICPPNIVCLNVVSEK